MNIALNINAPEIIPVQEKQNPLETKRRGRHVLVMALSTFPYAKEIVHENGTRKETKMPLTAYFYEKYVRKSAEIEDIDNNSSKENTTGRKNPEETEFETTDDSSLLARGEEQEGKGKKSHSEGKMQRVLRHICNGYYQLEPVSWFIKKELEEYVTDVVLLETKETIKDKREHVFPSPYLQRPDPDDPGTVKRTGSSHSDKTVSDRDTAKTTSHGPEERTEWSVAEYFIIWLKEFWGQELTVHEIKIDELDPAGALTLVTKKIRELYNETGNKESWRLWMDTHGGFRDISMVLISAARFFATDGKEPIDTNGIFSVYHSQKRKEKKKEEQKDTKDKDCDKDSPIGDRIIDQTAFYFTESAEALKRFLDYGQYLAHKFQPYRGSEKHAFVSYRHDIELLTSIRNIFTKFEGNGILYWYDDGIRYRTDWKEELEKQNREAEVFIALLSNSYFESVECWKELIRAVSGKKNNYEKIHFLLLEQGVRIPESPENSPLSDADKKEIGKLQMELGVSDEDLRECLGIGNENRNVQWFKWFEYMDKNVAIKQRTPEDIDGQIRDVFARIRNAINT